MIKRSLVLNLGMDGNRYETFVYFCLFDPEGQIAGYSLSLHAA